MDKAMLSAFSSGGQWPLALVTLVSKSWLLSDSSLFTMLCFCLRMALPDLLTWFDRPHHQESHGSSVATSQVSGMS